MKEIPRKDERYRSSEGEICRIVGVARDADSLGEVVIFFMEKESGALWTFDLPKFMGQYTRLETGGMRSVSGKDESEESPLMLFLDARSVAERIRILKDSGPAKLNNGMIDAMAVSLDTEIAEGEVAARYEELVSYLETRQKYEQHRRS